VDKEGAEVSPFICELNLITDIDYIDLRGREERLSYLSIYFSL